MWEIVDDYYRHTEFPEYEIHDGTHGSRFELHNTRTGTRTPLFMDQFDANIHTVMDTVDEVLRVRAWPT